MNFRRAELVVGLGVLALLGASSVEVEAQNGNVVTTCPATAGLTGSTSGFFMDAGGNLCINLGSITSVPIALTPVTASSALASSQVLKGSAGAFYGAQVNSTSAAEWVMLFNATVLPSNGAVTPVAWWQVAANSTLSISEGIGLSLSTGIVLGCSTSGPFTLTASTLCTFGSGVVK